MGPLPGEGPDPPGLGRETASTGEGGRTPGLVGGAGSEMVDFAMGEK